MSETIFDIKLDEDEQKFLKRYEAEIDTRLGYLLSELQRPTPNAGVIASRIAEISMLNFKLGILYADSIWQS